MDSPEEGHYYSYTKSILALSKLCFERLLAICCTWLKISDQLVFQTPGKNQSALCRIASLVFWRTGKKEPVGFIYAFRGVASFRLVVGLAHFPFHTSYQISRMTSTH